MNNISLKVMTVNITWPKEKSVLQHYAIEGDNKAQHVISWIYNTSCGITPVVSDALHKFKTANSNAVEVGMNSSHGNFYKFHSVLGLSEVAEIREEWVYEECTFLPIEEFLRVVKEFIELFQSKKEGVLTFSIYDVSCSFRADADDFDEDGNSKWLSGDM